MNFWEAQRRARLRTALYILTFVFLTLAVAFLMEVVAGYLAQQGYLPPMPLGLYFLIITFVVAGVYYLVYASQGGSFVARSLGGKKILSSSPDFKEQVLLNVVQEMAVASGQPMPEVYVIEAKEINAFAAGLKPEKAAITVTRGALEFLNRDELQGVIAHEFGHIANADMKINMRLAAMIMGLVFIFYIGIRILQGSLIYGGRSERKGNPTALIALIFLLAGLVTWFAGAILRATVSRQREYLADASSVQYTRNPSAIANALRKIDKMSKVADVHDMPRQGLAYSHLYFENRSFWALLFATHPPIEKRIAAIEGRKYLDENLNAETKKNRR